MERLKHENLKLQLEITQAQLELAKLQHSPSPASPQAAQSINAPSALHEALAASTLCQLHDLAAANFPTLEQLRDKKKPGASLPHNYVFSTQGTLSYDSLELPNFVYGYLEYVKEQPNLSHPALISHLQLLMQRAATYTWASVRSFHLAIATAVEQGRLTWNGFDTIRERSQTSFSHNDLRPSRPSDPSWLSPSWSHSGQWLYFHSRLPFGLRSATMACQQTTKAVTHILHDLGLSIDIYIDDFYSIFRLIRNSGRTTCRRSR